MEVLDKIETKTLVKDGHYLALINYDTIMHIPSLEDVVEGFILNTGVILFLQGGQFVFHLNEELTVDDEKTERFNNMRALCKHKGKMLYVEGDKLYVYNGTTDFEIDVDMDLYRDSMLDDKGVYITFKNDTYSFLRWSELATPP